MAQPKSSLGLAPNPKSPPFRHWWWKIWSWWNARCDLPNVSLELWSCVDSGRCINCINSPAFEACEFHLGKSPMAKATPSGVGLPTWKRWVCESWQEVAGVASHTNPHESWSCLAKPIWSEWHEATPRYGVSVVIMSERSSSKKVFLEQPCITSQFWNQRSGIR